MVLAQVYEGTWEELEQYREQYGNHRLILSVMPDNHIPVTENNTQVREPRRAGRAKGLFRMAPDFDAPLEDFKEYME